MPRTVVNENSNFHLTCLANGSLPVTYEWTQNGVAKSSGKELNIASVSRGDSGSYICTAINDFGIKESVLHELTVNCKFLFRI